VRIWIQALLPWATLPFRMKLPPIKKIGFRNKNSRKISKIRNLLQMMRKKKSQNLKRKRWPRKLRKNKN
jgi:hypothetical protein